MASRYWQKCKDIFNKTPIVLRYGVILSLSIILIKTLEYQLFSYRFSIELYTGLVALFFVLVGIATGLGWLNNQDTKSTHSLNSENAHEIEAVKEPLTTKELIILQGVKQGLSNQQIADKNHVSVNTVKSHLKNIYKKMGVVNRAQAAQKAKLDETY
ncbi:response regulator transcription factor [Aliiglaciecola lipolytica]|uniref:HTH luxR-type domain-containing protein n=1 Tax=Aliiglaciecola lipolytica E3 TaxID=1127673 RepID=K6YHJ0_9ALTE|nr:helix-turn-helix transcriptional regulator [Aliiglaciecola lipolytica]GAC16093.1 hypothetical protein GLIP_3479 [Aliiglaciecola lipolytica E3]